MNAANRNTKPPRSRARWWGCAIATASLLVPVIAVSLERGDRLSRISDGDTASEYWDIVARFDQEYSLFARFMITNEGPGKRTAFASWYLTDPDGELVAFRNGRRKKRWTLSPNGDRIEIGSSIFDQSGPVHLLEYDSSKRDISVQFRFSPTGPIAWTDAPVPGIYSIDLLDLGTPVTGTIQTPGMKEAVSVTGTIGVAHTWMEESEADIALRRIEFASEGEGPSIYLSDLTTPSGQRHRWLIVERDGEVTFRATDFELELIRDAESPKSDYPTPVALRIQGPGIEGKIDAGTTLVEVDPMEEIPQPFRFLLSLKTRPHRVWKPSSFQLSLKADPSLPATVLHGAGVTTITFLNPLPPLLSKTDTGNSGA
jgi:hypothetical protein